MVEISSADRVAYAATGTTKGAVVGHYLDVADRMLWHVSDRPLTVERYPRGVAAGGFMQKNTPDYFPDFIRRYEAPRRDGTTIHPVVDDRAGLIYLANHNTITFHMPIFRASAPDVPDRIIVDLDPPEGATAEVRSAAWQVKELLDSVGLTSVPVATGSKGFHVTAPTAGALTMAEANEISRLLAAVLVARHPDRFTTEFYKDDRSGRVFCDWMRNRWTATSVAPWSLRPKSRPTVAVPIEWDDLDSTAPDQFELGDVPTADPLRTALEAASPHDALKATRAVAAELGVGGD